MDSNDRRKELYAYYQEKAKTWMVIFGGLAILAFCCIFGKLNGLDFILAIAAIVAFVIMMMYIDESEKYETKDKNVSNNYHRSGNAYYNPNDDYYDTVRGYDCDDQFGNGYGIDEDLDGDLDSDNYDSEYDDGYDD